MADDPLYICPCGYGPKSFFAVMGHRGRSKNPLCRSGDLRPVSVGEAEPSPQLETTPAVPSAPEPAVASLNMEAESAQPQPPAPAVVREAPPVGKPMAGSERKVAGAVLTPSTVKPTIELPMLAYVYYDGFRAHFGYEGSFDQWVYEIIEHYMALAGARTELTVAFDPLSGVA